MKKRTPSPQTASHTPCVSSHAWVHAWVRPRCFTSIHHRADKLSNRRVTPHLGLIRATLACMFLLATFAAVHAQSTLNLFNGLSLLGWTPHGSWTGNGGILSSSGAGNRGIVTVVPFEDFTLVFDYNESAPVGAKLRLWAPREGSGGAYIDLDLSGAQNKVGGVEGSRPSPIASMSEGWHHVQVEASHGHLDIHVDGQQAGTLTGNGPRAGYLGWDVTGSGNFQVRAVKLIPRGLTSAFNGSDLGGWKPVAHDPSSNGGIGHTVVKTFSFGLGGGSTKPHSAKWTVASGAMQGQDGPGGLEYSAPFDDGIVELNASVKGSIKSDHVTGVGLRDQPGKLGGGYLVGVGPYSGTIDGLAKHAISKSTNKVQETIAIAGRTTEIWESGNIVTVDTDPRAESDRTSAGAKTSAGALTLILPPDCTLDVQQIAVATLPAKGYGAAVARDGRRIQPSRHRAGSHRSSFRGGHRPVTQPDRCCRSGPAGPCHQAAYRVADGPGSDDERSPAADGSLQPGRAARPFQLSRRAGFPGCPGQGAGLSDSSGPAGSGPDHRRADHSDSGPAGQWLYRQSSECPLCRSHR
jgi:hypothetical protein